MHLQVKCGTAAGSYACIVTNVTSLFVFEAVKRVEQVTAKACQYKEILTVITSKQFDQSQSKLQRLFFKQWWSKKVEVKVQVLVVF